MEPLLSKFYLLVGWEPYTWLTIFMIATTTADVAPTVKGHQLDHYSQQQHRETLQRVECNPLRSLI